MSFKRPVSVFEYTDYRTYLRDHYQEQKAGDHEFSHRSFSKRAGLRSTNYLKLVMDGDRNLTQKMAYRFASACGLEGRAVDYFCDLVAFNQATTAAEMDRCHERLMRFRRYRARHQLEVARTYYCSNWYVPAIQELALLPGFDPDPKRISRALMPHISAEQARHAIATLLQLGLLVRDGPGRMIPITDPERTKSEPLGCDTASYQRAMLGRAAVALEDASSSECDISSVTLGVSQELLRELKLRIVELRRQLIQLAELGGNPDRVIQFSVQLFPLSQKMSAF